MCILYFMRGVMSLARGHNVMTIIIILIIILIIMGSENNDDKIS